MANQPPIVNLDELPLETYGRGADFQSGLGRITRRLGKDTQIEAWRSLAKSFPEPIKKAAGVDNWA